MKVIQFIIRLFRQPVQIYLDLKVIWKLMINFGCILIIVFLIAGVSSRSITRFNNNLLAVINEELQPLAYLHDIRSFISDMEITSKDAILQKDAVALNYIHNEYLPNTVRKTVDYSFKELLKNTRDSKIKRTILEFQEYWFQ